MGRCGWISVPLQNGEEPPLPALDLGLGAPNISSNDLLCFRPSPMAILNISLNEFEAHVAVVKRKQKHLKKLRRKGKLPYLTDEDLRLLLWLDAKHIITISEKGVKATPQANSKVKEWLQTNQPYLYNRLKREMDSLHVPPSAEPIQIVSQFLKKYTVEKIRGLVGRAFEFLLLPPRGRELAIGIYIKTQYPFVIKHMRRILLGVLIEKNCVDLIFAVLCLGVKKKWF